MSEQIFELDYIHNIPFENVSVCKKNVNDFDITMKCGKVIKIGGDIQTQFIKEYNEWLLLPKEPTIIILFGCTETPVTTSPKDLFIKLSDDKQSLILYLQNGTHYVHKTVLFQDKLSALDELNNITEFIISGNKKLILDWSELQSQ